MISKNIRFAIVVFIESKVVLHNNKVLKNYLSLFNILNTEIKRSFYFLLFVSISLSILDALFLIFTSRVIKSFSRNFSVSFLEKIQFFDSIFSTVDPRYRVLAFFLLVLLAISFFRLGLKLFYRKEAAFLAKKVSSCLSLKMFEGIINLNYLNFTRLNESRIIHLLTKDQLHCGKFIYDSILLINNLIIGLVILITAVFLVSPIILIVIPIVGFIYLKAFRRITNLIVKNSKKGRNTAIKRLAIINNLFTIMPLPFIDNKTNFFKKNFVDFDKKTKLYNARNLFLNALPQIFSESLVTILGTFGLLVILLFGFSLERIFEPATIIFFASKKIRRSFSGVSSTYATMVNHIQAVTAVLEFISKNSSPNKKLLISKSINSENSYFGDIKSIILKNISFKYPNSSNSLFLNLNLSFAKGDWVLIKGKSGSGKSSFILLILGLLNSTQGEIEINSIKNKKQKRQKLDSNNLISYRNQIAYVPQDIYLIEGTIAENIAFSRIDETIDYDLIRKICQISCLDDYLKQLPKGLETLVSSRNTKMSGGQRQRIGLARALYKKAQVFIFDESTSALDGKLTKNILDNLKNYLKNKTVFFISHNPKDLDVKCNKEIIFISNKGVSSEVKLLKR